MVSCDAESSGRVNQIVTRSPPQQQSISLSLLFKMKAGKTQYYRVPKQINWTRDQRITLTVLEDHISQGFF